MLHKKLHFALLFAGICFSGSIMASATDVAENVNQRLSWMKDVAGYKAVRHLPIEDLQQEANVLAKSVAEAEKLGLDGHSVRPFIQAQMDAAKAIQYRYRADWLTAPEVGWQPQPLDVIRTRLSQLNTTILRDINENLQHKKLPDRDTFIQTVKQPNLSEKEVLRLWQTLNEIKRQ